MLPWQFPGIKCCTSLQDIVRKIWEIKEEPEWMLEFRLNAFRTRTPLSLANKLAAQLKQSE